MFIPDVLIAVCELEELKKRTPITENVLQSVHKVLESLKEGKKLAFIAL